MLAVAIIEPLTEEDGTLEDVDPEKGHEDNPTKSRWVMLKNSPKERPRFNALIPHKSLRLNIDNFFSLALRLAQHWFDKIILRIRFRLVLQGVTQVVQTPTL